MQTRSSRNSKVRHIWFSEIRTHDKCNRFYHRWLTMLKVFPARFLETNPNRAINLSPDFWCLGASLNHNDTVLRYPVITVPRNKTRVEFWSKFLTIKNLFSWKMARKLFSREACFEEKEEAENVTTCIKGWIKRTRTSVICQWLHWAPARM